MSRAVDRRRLSPQSAATHSGAARGEWGEASPLWVDVQKLCNMCVLSLSWNFFVSHDKYSARPSSKEPRWYTGTTGDTFRIVIHLSSTEYDNFSLSLVPVSTKVLQWYQTPQSTPTATPPSSARRLLGDYRGVEWNRCLRRSGEFLRYWITGKPLSWQFSIIYPQLWRISLLYVRAESIIKLRQWSCLNPWMLSTKLAFDHCIAKHHSVRCSW